MATFIHGIAASENIDTSGEKVSVSGMDISSLAKDGVFNWEHKKDTPSQVVGKVLKAKKIFSEDDCESEHERYFWHKISTPFVYVMGELFDDYNESAKEVAGFFKYDADKRGQNEFNVVSFSIEGGKIEKKGMEVTRSVARKVTITILPCNKAAIAEIVQEKPKDGIDSLFKTESVIEIEVFKPTVNEMSEINREEEMQKHADALGIEPMNKALPKTTVPGMAAKQPAKPMAGDAPKLPAQTTNPGKLMGTTKSGKNIHTHAKIHEYKGFSGQDHQEAANMHHAAASAAKDPKTGKHHLDKMNLHLQAARTAEMKEKRLGIGQQAMKEKFENRHILGKAEEELEKTLTAGSGMSAPSQKVGGEALAKEDIHMPKKAFVAEHKKLVNVLKHPSKKKLKEEAEEQESELNEELKKKKSNLKKSDWFARAEEEYQKWEKREEFRAFMKKRMPHLTKGEVDAIGRTMALKKALDAEKTLATMVNIEIKEKKNK